MAKVIMIQGTMSGAGKSMLAAGLCRIFARKGLRTAPFKSQNMALNSYITRDGLEMGRAQVMKAEAAGLEQDVRMNPVLLKPTSDTGSQVIVGGKVRADMDARAYFRYKKELIPEILDAYRSLSRENDIIVVEGAGSPAEINLKSDDIVNMGLAKMIGSPVLVVGDIDRGGVFAQLAGTWLLLEQEERRYVKGLVINKFRGDKSILDPGVAMLKKYTPVTTVGVIPYVDLDLDDEDSLSGRLEQNRAQDGKLDIAVIRLPHLSNFTDFNALSRSGQAAVRYIRFASELGHPDLLILPGSKNTMGDLRWMRKEGLEEAVVKAARSGLPVLGICGGYQMLGRSIQDPAGVEDGGEIAGLGLLPVETVFAGSKRRTRAGGRVCSLSGTWKALSGTEFEGYEIHMGRSRILTEHGSAADPQAQNQPVSFSDLKLLQDRQTHADGCQTGNVCGTYVHGLFDNAAMQKALLSMLLERVMIRVM